MQGITRLGGELDAPSFVSQTPEGLEAVAKALQLPGGGPACSPALSLLLLPASPPCSLLWLSIAHLCVSPN